MDSSNPRRHALEVFSRALAAPGRVLAQEMLDERFARAPLKPEDKRLAADLAYGVIRRKATLDAVLAAYADRNLSLIEGVVRDVLRLGVYQILFHERVPDHAAVDEAVSLIRATGHGRSSGFVNAILRNVVREATFIDAPDPTRPRHSFVLTPGRACRFERAVLPPPADLGAWMAVVLSYPEWLVRRWLARYGTTRARAMLEAANLPPPLFVRANTLRIDIEGLRARLAAEGADAVSSPSGRTLRLPPRVQPAALPSFQQGLCIVQDDAGAAVAPFLDPHPGESVLDLCAAPGGKTTHCAALMQNSGRILAVDISARRLRRVSENAGRAGVSIITAVEGNGADVAVRHRREFDRVLIDAPCLNTGVLRRRVEARWRLGDRPLADLARIQRELLRAGLEAVKPGGALVYSTCSLEPEENEDLVRHVLPGAPACRLDKEIHLLPSGEGGDGCYMARITRAAE